MFDLLPPEIMLEVFAWIGARDLARVRRVSKQWRRLIGSQKSFRGEMRRSRLHDDRTYALFLLYRVATSQSRVVSAPFASRYLPLSGPASCRIYELTAKWQAILMEILRCSKCFDSASIDDSRRIFCIDNPACGQPVEVILRNSNPSIISITYKDRKVEIPDRFFQLYIGGYFSVIWPLPNFHNAHGLWVGRIMAGYKTATMAIAAKKKILFVPIGYAT